ncbi:MAG: ABC transporter permease [Chloroflexi bacterium]|nr:ABC transporter permease [Chloroflexota bacterium]
MTKLWHVAWHEYRRHVFNRRFVLVGLLSVPLLVLVMVGLVFLIISLDINTTPLGYVDYSGLLADPLPAPAPEPPDRPVPILPFETEAAARSALDAGQIQAYYVLPADYLSIGWLSVVNMGALKSPARTQFYNFLTANLLRSTDPVIANRLVKGAEIIVQSPDGSRSISSKNWFNVMIPIVAGIAFIIAIFSTGGYLMQAVVEEKENRTMEVIITSVSPNQFMAGKIIGDTAIGLTQIFLWMLFIVIPILVLRNSMSFLRGIQIAPQTLLLVVFVMLPAFILVSALMAAIGATISEAREGQQMVGIISLPIWIPYMLIGLLIGNPNSPVAVGLSLFPLTAPLTLLLRDGMTILPAWQIALSAVIQVLCAVGAIWLAGRAFRLGMLRYGKRLKWREVFARN